MKLPALGFVLTLLLTRAAAGDQVLEIDRYVELKMRDHVIPGLALVVVRGGTVVHRRGFGELATDSPLIIGSLSKAFTATAVLQLVDAGRIRLDEPVSTYLPDFTPDGPDAARITVRHLLNHTSGLPTHAQRAASRDAALADHVRALDGAALVARPGERHVYSSPGYQVLGRLVEVVSGEDFGAYLERHVFSPLAMTRSATDSARLAPVPGHNLWWGLAGPSFYRWEPGRLPTASLIVSADDLATFALAHLGVVTGETAPLLTAGSLAEAHRGAADGGGFAYAMGWREGTTAGVPSLWHGGALPSYRGALVLVPQTRSAVVVLTNVSTLFADSTREIAAGVVALTHEGPLPSGFRPLRQTYLVIAVGSALLLALQVRSLVRAWRRSEPRKGSPARIVVFDLVLPVALLVLLPRFAKVSWRGILESAPDIAVATVAVVLLALATGVLRLRRARSPLA